LDEVEMVVFDARSTTIAAVMLQYSPFQLYLIEAAWLKARGHEQDVDCCSDAMRHRLIEAHPGARTVRVRALQPPHAILLSQEGHILTEAGQQ
jgi:hypothetical protein